MSQPTIESVIEEVKKCLARPEWSEEQRVFFQKNPHMAALSERYLQSLDSKITILEKKLRFNPFSKHFWSKLLK